MAGGAASASDSANAPRTSRHAAPAQSTPQTPARARFPRSSPVSPGDTMSVPVHPSGPDATSAFVPLEADAPRPIGVDPSETGSFSRLSSGQGARLTTRDNAMEAREAATISREYSGDRRMSQSRRPKVASHQTKTTGSRKVFIGIAIAVAAVVAVGFFLLHSLLSAGSDQPDTPTQLEQTQVAVDQAITYNDATYRLTQQDDGSYALTRAYGDGEATALFTLTGTPVQLVLCNGALIVPENLDGSWDVIAYTLADGSVPVQVADADGNPVGGDGSISSVTLEDTVLHVETDAGTVDVTVG